MASTSLAPYSEDTELLMDVSETFIPPSEDDFENTVELLQIMDVEELNGEVAISLEEVEGSSQFACQYCPKLCKSKGGLTKHIRSKHVGWRRIDLKRVREENTATSLENMLSIIRDIGKYLSDESIYKKEHIVEIFGLIPSASFVSAMNDILKKFYGNRDQDKMLQRFYGETSKNWKAYFIPCEDQKIVNLMLIHLPERSLKRIRQLKKRLKYVVEICISPQEQGPLTYVIGYVLQSLYRKSINSPRWNSPRNKEIQALVSSMRIPTEENDYIFSLSRRGLWTPNSSVVSIAEVSELSFKMYTNTGKDRTTRLPVDKIVDEVLTSPLVKSLWCNIVENCDVPISKECQTLCLENIVKLYITVRCFSFAKDIVNKYKLKEKVQQKKALRKQLKLGSE